MMLFVKAWGVVAVMAAGAAAALEVKTNEWVPEPGAGYPYPESHEGIQVAQRLTDAEVMQIVAGIEEVADPAILARIRNQPGWDVDVTSAILAREMFKDMEWASRKACLWCLAPKQLPENFPHYRSHYPNCPVDMVCSGLVRSVPMQSDEYEIWWEVQAAPFVGYVWDPASGGTEGAWVSPPPAEAPAAAVEELSLGPPEFAGQPETQDQTRFEQE